jgi:hypothetical protein
MPSRASLVEHLAGLTGRDVLRVVDRRNGWPGIVRVRVGGDFVPAALHVGPIGLSHRGRDDVERRFQNPGQGKEVQAPGGAKPLLLGLWEEARQPVLVAMDAEHRLGRMTRQSMFIPLATLHDAANRGWAEHTNTAGERITAFHPALLPIYLDAQRQDVALDPVEMEQVLGASDLLMDIQEPPADAPVERRADSFAAQYLESESWRHITVYARCVA